MKTCTIAAIAAAIAGLSGCSPRLLVPSPLPVCKVDSTLLRPCANAELSDTGTFADALRNLQQSRQKLSECELRRAALQDRILSCNESIEAYNRKIKEDAAKK